MKRWLLDRSHLKSKPRQGTAVWDLSSCQWFCSPKWWSRTKLCCNPGVIGKPVPLTSGWFTVRELCKGNTYYSDFRSSARCQEIIHDWARGSLYWHCSLVLLDKGVFAFFLSPSLFLCKLGNFYVYRCSQDFCMRSVEYCHFCCMYWKLKWDSLLLKSWIGKGANTCDTSWWNQLWISAFWLPVLTLLACTFP